MNINVQNLCKSFRDGEKVIPVIKELSFVIPSATSCAVVGKSGVGKSTLLNLIGGLDTPDSGFVQLGADVVEGDSDALSKLRRDTVSFIFQFHHLFSEFSATENVAMPLLIKGSSYSEVKSRAEFMLERVGMGDRMEHRPGMLSGGEQQRVSIARALISEPDVILADEPTGSLDPETGSKIVDLLFELQEQSEVTLVVVSHDLSLANKMDKVLELK